MDKNIRKKMLVNVYMKKQIRYINKDINISTEDTRNEK